MKFHFQLCDYERSHFFTPDLFQPICSTSTSSKYSKSRLPKHCKVLNNSETHIHVCCKMKLWNLLTPLSSRLQCLPMRYSRYIHQPIEIRWCWFFTAIFVLDTHMSPNLLFPSCVIKHCIGLANAKCIMFDWRGCKFDLLGWKCVEWLKEVLHRCDLKILMRSLVRKIKFAAYTVSNSRSSFDTAKNCLCTDFALFLVENITSLKLGQGKASEKIVLQGSLCFT